MPRASKPRIEKPLVEFVFVALQHPYVLGKPQWREERTEESGVVVYRPSSSLEHLLGEKIVGTKVTCKGIATKRVKDPLVANSITHCQVLVREIVKIEPPSTE